MITMNDQLDLFKLISARLKKDIICYAFGGTAMMFYGFKETTKDIDLVFEDKNSMNDFIKAIESLGYKQKSLAGIYDNEHIKRAGKPLLYTRGDERFDLFAGKIFTTPLTETIKNNFLGQYDFKEGKNALIIRALSKESIILLKSITEREKDYEDCLLLLQKDNTISWDKITDMAVDIYKKDHDNFVILDLEKTMQRLKKEIFIPQRYFEKLYNANNK